MQPQINSITVDFIKKMAQVVLIYGSTNQDGTFVPNGMRNVMVIQEPYYTQLIANLQAQNALNLDVVLATLTGQQQ